MWLLSKTMSFCSEVTKCSPKKLSKIWQVRHLLRLNICVLGLDGCYCVFVFLLELCNYLIFFFFFFGGGEVNEDQHRKNMSPVGEPLSSSGRLCQTEWRLMFHFKLSTHKKWFEKATLQLDPKKFNWIIEARKIL